MSADAPVLDTLTDMTAASVTRSSLTPRDFMLARLAALIAVDGPPISYLANAPALEESGLTAEDIQGVMIAVAPVVGAPRVMSAGGHILRALGIEIAIAQAEAEMADERSRS
jgi:alkylhydroperoxidase/carboxymuconolactone decarboxylase family protein YurZ